MWKYNSDYKKWSMVDDRVSKFDFDLLKQDLQATRFYSKCLSGATYLPANDLSDLYSILGSYKQRDWYVGFVDTPYSITSIPPQHATVIDSISFEDYYTRYINEYGLTLKNLFTPNRLIKDSLDNYKYVDVATTDAIDILNLPKPFVLDGVTILEGHRILVKNQTTNIVLLSSVDPDTYFTGKYTLVQDLGGTREYQYFNEENGIYLYTNKSLVKQDDLKNYLNCIRYSVNVKMGTVNSGKQFHLSRLISGYFPTTSLNQPIEFKEKKNYIVRNRVDYNNIFETNYYDIYKHATQSYFFEGMTYSIPERSIAVGEFGVINNTQEGKSNIIPCKYKVNLRSIAETQKYYWICGDEGVLLRVRKHDFNIYKVEVDCLCPQGRLITSLKSVSFFNDLRGVAVGELNTILITKDGGFSWKRLKYPDFNEFNYNKVIYDSLTTFYIGGTSGLFLEFVEGISGYTVYRRRVSKIVNDEDEYLLVDNINDLYKASITSWGVTYSYFTQSIASNKDFIFIVSDSNKIFAYDKNNCFNQIDSNFVYFDFGVDYGDIKNITRRDGTNYFYFTGTDVLTSQDGIFSFDINDFTIIGTGSSYSNTTISQSPATFEYAVYPNEVYDYVGTELLIAGNNGLFQYSTYSTLNFGVFDSTYEQKLKSKMLFLDYDIASKLNFFTDAGEYRLPTAVTFSNSSMESVGEYLYFRPIEHGYTPTNGGTFSEVNWFQYWTDSLKTFEFYSTTPFATEVLISPTFSYATNSSNLTIDPTSISGGYISSSSSVVSQFVPMETFGLTGSRFTWDTTTQLQVPYSPPTAKMWLYDYLMIWRVDPTYPVSVGDVLSFSSSVVDTELVVNRIKGSTGPGSWKYLFMYTEFNDDINKSLVSMTYSFDINNLNKYTSVQELKDNFNSHPISTGYQLDYVDSYGNVTTSTSSVFQVSGKFNNLTSYYNLGTEVVLNGTYSTMKYTDTFLNFGYSPTYNLLDYLQGINDVNDVNPKFYDTKEYLAMPVYESMPLGSLTASNVYIDYNGMTYSGGSMSLPGNKIYLGSGYNIEYNSIFVNTFVDVIIYGSSTYTNERMLVMDKYYDKTLDAYVIEFHKRLNFTLYDPVILNGGKIDIKSRRKLSQISQDLQLLNNIQRTKTKKNSWLDQDVWSYYSYENELNAKIPTDSYAKILLSDTDTIQQLSAIIYVDYKNELAMNITRLSRQYSVPILNTFEFNGKLYVSCSQKHDLLTGDAAVLEFTGGVGSSQELNNSYFGYHVITKITDYDFLTDIDYGTITTVGNDIGFVKYTKQDPFFNYAPVDLIEYGVDKRGKQSVELSIENLVLTGVTYSLQNVDFEKYRFRLIDNLDLDTVVVNYPWLLEAEISGAVIGLYENDFGKGITWYKGTWECGRWFGGTWHSGTWLGGDWYDGVWNSFNVTDKKLTVEVDRKSTNLESSLWYDGRWYTGTWNYGRWHNGRWYGGTWSNGVWDTGTWNDGTWNNGLFQGGIWVLGKWNSGIFNTDYEPAYWLDGNWYGGDFENGMWYDGTWEQKNGLSRFGTKAYNSRTANWQAGKWVSGSFYSKINYDDEGYLDVCDIHKYSIWKTGSWMSGEWYGGIAYNMDYKTGTWYGGILEDIQVIGVDTVNNTFTVNGIFKFNIGDDIYMIDNQVGNSYSVYGSNSNIGKYKVLYREEDNVNNYTTLYVNYNLATLGSSISAPYDTGLRIVSKFANVNWKTGIWTNGLYETGLWEGGIWYNGIFSGTWT